MGCAAWPSAQYSGSDDMNLYEDTAYNPPPGANTVPRSKGISNQGCYNDSTSSRLLTGGSYVDTSGMTVDKCIQKAGYVNTSLSDTPKSVIGETSLPQLRRQMAATCLVSVLLPSFAEEAPPHKSIRTAIESFIRRRQSQIQQANTLRVISDSDFQNFVNSVNAFRNKYSGSANWALKGTVAIGLASEAIEAAKGIFGWLGSIISNLGGGNDPPKTSNPPTSRKPTSVPVEETSTTESSKTSFSVEPSSTDDPALPYLCSICILWDNGRIDIPGRRRRFLGLPEFKLPELGFVERDV
ncbi:hypothetical protein K469DRAFT_684156 [Zopfia rhizophila CBS 207.26]|uniref:Uncharacterized protein n=1 Tax=Zopfia rhizophila CBS 207.26 TaxID=1314779 RepID=A0A6A6ECE4_9PEZI|nr:hypothetical protein K469DRAFT_684156 [Zopfia rhizophila CBS 207.26]